MHRLIMSVAVVALPQASVAVTVAITASHAPDTLTLPITTP